MQQKRMLQVLSPGFSLEVFQEGKFPIYHVIVNFSGHKFAKQAKNLGIENFNSFVFYS